MIYTHVLNRGGERSPESRGCADIGTHCLAANGTMPIRISRQSGVVDIVEKALSRNENHIGLCTRCSHIMPINILNSYDSVSRYGEY